jgi:hypothetical protein
MQTCNHCQGTGFLNIEQYTEITKNNFFDMKDPHSAVLEWLKRDQIIMFWDHDISVCDCCGDGKEWYGTPGEHYNSDDQIGHDGPYAYNGGLCECH